MCLTKIYYLFPLLFVSLLHTPIISLISLNCSALLLCARWSFHLSLCQIKIYYFSLLVTFSLAHSHTSSKISEFPYLLLSARQSFHLCLCLIKIYYLSRPIIFSLAHSHTSCKISEFPQSAALCQVVFPSISVPNNNLFFISSVRSNSGPFNIFCNNF